MNGYKAITDPRNPHIQRVNGYMSGGVPHVEANGAAKLKVFELFDSLDGVEPIGHIIDDSTNEQYEEYSISEIFDFFSHTATSLEEYRRIKICKRVGTKVEDGQTFEHPWVLFVPTFGGSGTIDFDSLLSLCIPHNELREQINKKIAELKNEYKSDEIYILKDDVHYSTDDNRFITAVITSGVPYCDYNESFNVYEIKLPIKKISVNFDVETGVSFSTIDGMFTGDVSLFFSKYCIPHGECSSGTEGLRIHKLFSDLITENERTIKFIQAADECLLPPDKGESEIKKCESVISLKDRINNETLTTSMMDYIRTIS